MNRNYRVITINGIRGMIVAVFVVSGLISGFIISPGYVCMKIWNYVFDGSSAVASMNLFQGIILWAIIALSLYALNNKRALIGFCSYGGLTPEEIERVMKRNGDFEALKKAVKERSEFNLPNVEKAREEQNDNNITDEINAESGEEARR